MARADDQPHFSPNNTVTLSPQAQESAASLTQGCVPASTTALPTTDQECVNATRNPLFPTQESVQVPTAIPAPLSTDDRRFVDTTSMPPSHPQDHVSTSLSAATISHIQTPPHTLHPTLSSWLKNLNKLSSLLDRLEELASFAPAEYRTRLSRQVATLRTRFKKQKERCIGFLKLSEEYADKYLLDISAEIRQQSSFLDMLEKRLDMVKALHRQVVDLRKLYESGIVANTKDFRSTGKASPRCPQRKNAETYGFQHYFSRFQRISTSLVKWTLC